MIGSGRCARIAAGVYEWRGHTIRRAGAVWEVSGDLVGAGGPSPAPTLRAAQETIRHHLILLRAWDDERRTSGARVA